MLLNRDHCVSARHKHHVSFRAHFALISSLRDGIELRFESLLGGSGTKIFSLFSFLKFLLKGPHLRLVPVLKGNEPVVFATDLSPVSTFLAIISHVLELADESEVFLDV